MKKIAFIGLGLIGGSIARALKKNCPDEYKILAYAGHRETLEEAKAVGAIDGMLDVQDPGYADCDYIFLCAPVEYNLQYLNYLKDVISPDCILTDVGSVKGEIHELVHSLGLDGRFIGGHPMAGSEKTGFSNSSDRLLENAYYMLTPGAEVPLDKISEFTELVTKIGCVPMIVTADEHDFITAGVSHLPHLIASALVNLVKNLDNEEEAMKTIAAGGFRDITRIASSSTVMWEQICVENSKNISVVLDEYIRMLVQIRCAVDNKDGAYINQMFVSSRDYRDSIDVITSGPLKKIFVLYLDIADEAGSIAAIATILASEQISMKNIGIIHNREFEEGALKIEFYEENAMNLALALLQKRNYHVIERRI